MDVGIVILAGGKSSRMGTNKALLQMEGKTVIERLRDELKTIGPHPRVMVVTNDPDTYQFLNEPLVQDRYPGEGPLAGIQVGLTATGADWNVVAACDMPFVSKQVAQFLFEQALANDGIDAVVPVIAGQLHPLFAVYHKRSAEKIEEMILAGRLRMVHLLEQLRVKQVTEADFPAEIDVDRVFFNMNRPEEWAQVQQWMKREGGADA